ncbi:hypothetical protein ACXM5X_32300 [Pseudomonas saponiphila]
MNVTPDTTRHDELNRQAQGLTVQQPTAHLISRWTDEMGRLGQCVRLTICITSSAVQAVGQQLCYMPMSSTGMFTTS